MQLFLAACPTVCSLLWEPPTPSPPHPLPYIGFSQREAQIELSFSLLTLHSVVFSFQPLMGGVSAAIFVA